MKLNAPIRVHSAAVYPYTDSLAKKFQRISAFDEPFFLGRKVDYPSGSYLWLPREMCPEGEEDKRVVGVPAAFTSNFVARNDEQKRVIDESVDLLTNQRASHIIEAPTGFGKTWLTTEIISRVGKKTLIVVTKEDVKTQWTTALQKLLLLSDSELGYIQGDRCDVAGKKVVIALIQSVHKEGRYPPEVFKDFGLLVVDEVHRMGADKFAQTAWQVPALLRLGLSATPYRRDGKDVVFRGHIGNVLVRTKHEMLVPKVLMISSEWKVPSVRRYVRGEMKTIPWPHTPGRIAGLIRPMALSRTRNHVICKCVSAAYRKGRNIVIMSDSRKVHLEALYDLLPTYGIPIEDISFYVGGMKEQERAKAVSKRVVLATYKMTSEATDVPWWDTCVLATPKADVVQIVGRIRREWEGKPTPLVFDLVDDGSFVLDGYMRKRLRWYRSIRAEVKQLAA